MVVFHLHDRGRFGFFSDKVVLLHALTVAVFFFVYWRTCDIFRDVSTKGRICTCPGLSHAWGVDPIYNTCHVLSHASQIAVFFFFYFVLMLNTILIIITINLSKDRGSSYRILLSHAPRMWRYFISIIEVILKCKDVLMSIPEE